MINTVALIVVCIISEWGGVLVCGQPSGVLWGDQLFVGVAPREVPGRLYRGSFNSKLKNVRSPLEHLSPLNGEPFLATKIAIRDDRLLICQLSGSHYIFPVDIIPYLEDSKYGVKLRALREGKSEQKKARVQRDDPDNIELAEITCYSRLVDPFFGGANNYLLVPNHRESDVPTVVADASDGGRPSSRAYFEKVRYDMLIAGPRSVRLFHVYDGRLFVSIEPDYLINWYYNDKGEVIKPLIPPDRQLKTGDLPANFNAAEYFGS